MSARKCEPTGVPPIRASTASAFGVLPSAWESRSLATSTPALGDAVLAVRLGDELFHHLVDESLVDRAEVGDLGHDPLDFVLAEGLEDAGGAFLPDRDEQEGGLARTAHLGRGVSSPGLPS